MTQLVHPDLSVMDRPLFANATPAVFALIAEGLALGYRTGAWPGMPGGILWAALRAVERGEAVCPALAVIESKDVERYHAANYGIYDLSELTVAMTESQAAGSPHVVLPSTPCRGGTCEIEPSVFNSDRALTAGELLADIIAKFDFSTAANAPWRVAGHDVREIHEALLKDDGFVATDAMNARGLILDDSRAVYDKACELAERRGMWFLRGYDVQMAAIELGISQLPLAEQEAVRQQYQWSVDAVISQLDSGGCSAIYAFPGPKPWGPSAAELLGVGLADSSILAPWPTKEDMPQLIEQLSGDDGDQRWWALEYLSRLGGDAKPAVQAIAGCLGDDESSIRRTAARTLARLGPVAVDAIDVLIEALDDEVEDLQVWALVALAGIGPAAASALPRVLALRQQEDVAPGKRADIVSALVQIAPNTPGTRAAILDDLNSADVGFRTRAMRALATCDPLPGEAVGKLIEALGCEERFLPGTAAETLVIYGPAGESAVAALAEAVRAPIIDDDKGNPYRHWRSAEALGEIGPAAAEAVPALMAAMERDDGTVSAYAMLALGKIGQAAKDALPAIIKKLADPDSRGSFFAKAVGYFGPLAEEALPALLDMLVTGKTYDRAGAASALGRIAHTPEVVTALTAAAGGDKERCVRVCAAAALAGIDGQDAADLDKTVRPVLDDALSQGDDEDRAAAAYGLVRLGQVDEGLGILIGLLTDRDEGGLSYAATSAAEFLGELGPLAKQADEALVAATRRRDSRLTQAAWAALNRIRS